MIIIVVIIMIIGCPAAWLASWLARLRKLVCPPSLHVFAAHLTASMGLPACMPGDVACVLTPY